MLPDEAELVSRAARGEGPAFAELMQRHGRPVVALLRPLREVAELFYAEGLSIAEIARQLQCPTGTVKRRRHDARQHMRRTLGLDEEA